jgi:NADH-quinone oxidoreductase subunit M
MHTREIAAYGGLVNNMPKYAVAFLIFTMANVGLPGTSGFVGEFLTLVGVFQVNTWVALIRGNRRDPVGGLCAVALPPVVFGALTKESLKGMFDLSTVARRWCSMPLVILTIFFGVYPAPVLDATAASVKALSTTFPPSPIGRRRPRRRTDGGRAILRTGMTPDLSSSSLSLSAIRS